MPEVLMSHDLRLGVTSYVLIAAFQLPPELHKRGTK